MNEWFDKQDFIKKNSIVESNLVLGSRDLSDSQIQLCISIPTYCRADLLKEALESALSQNTHVKFEIIVVDNNNANASDTMKLMEEYTEKYPFISYYQNSSNLGMAGNWNRCIELSHRPWTLLLHDDDMLDPDYLETVFPAAQNSGCTLAAVFHYNYFRIPGNLQNYTRNHSFAQKAFSVLRRGRAFQVKDRDILKCILPSPVGVLLDTNTSIALGGYDITPEGKGIVDAKFHFSHVIHGKAIIIPQLLASKGIGENDYMNIEMPVKILTDFYNYARHYAENYYKFTGLQKLVLDITAVYMSYGIKEKYIRKAEDKQKLDALLMELGVRKFLLHMPKGLIFSGVCLTLSNLIFRKKTGTK